MALARSLRMRDLVILGLLFIGPAAPVGLFGTLDAQSGGVVPLVYLIATIVMGFTAWSYALMSRVVPSAGAVYAYARVGIGASAGFIAGWVILLDYLFIPAVAYLFSGISLNALIPAIPIWGWTLAAVIITTALNLTGLQKTRRITMTVLVVEVIVLALVLLGGLLVIWHQGIQRPLWSPFTGDGGLSQAAVFGGVSVAVLSYLGFDAISTFAEENQGGKDKPGKATLWCLILAGGLFIAQTWLGALLSTWDSETLRLQPELQGKAFYVMVSDAIAPWLGEALAGIKAIGAAFSAMIGQAAAGRLLFSMSREGTLPARLSQIQGRSGLPAAAVLAAACVNALLAVFAALLSDGLSLLVSFVDVGAICGFILLHAAVIGYFLVKQRRRDSAALVACGAMPVIGILVLLPVLLHMHLTALAAGGIWLAIGLLLLYRRKTADR
ncbi:APC family permease [Erwinia sp. HR93]|uniref:APC family permease n=1 Tax=Erwinia sp. HR93 TaxID=3094840 RepID=UPI002ADEF295|nr:APC family permease [Erwinia sp. HR93]MEA1064959.1 APC family permease [Erwinia sp. HR93]